MIKMVSLKCPECAASLSIEENRKQCFCEYCGTKIMIDDGSCTYTHIYIDKTREKELELEERRLRMEWERDRVNSKWRSFSFGMIAFSFVLTLISFVLIKDEFNILFTYVLLIIARITAIARAMKRESFFGVFLTVLIFDISSILFMVAREDFNTTFTIALAMSIAINFVASCVKSKNSDS